MGRQDPQNVSHTLTLYTRKACQLLLDLRTHRHAKEKGPSQERESSRVTTEFVKDKFSLRDIHCGS